MRVRCWLTGRRASACLTSPKGSISLGPQQACHCHTEVEPSIAQRKEERRAQGWGSKGCTFTRRVSVVLCSLFFGFCFFPPLAQSRGGKKAVLIQPCIYTESAIRREGALFPSLKEN